MQILTRDAIDQLGATTVADIFRYVPQQSFVAAENNTFAGARPVQLRGLGLGTTLVLIDGRRTVTSALQGARNFFDLSMLPAAAVDRVEILADSASAVYGADAVGGVVNVILKKSVDAPSVDLYFGGADGGGRERHATFTGGHRGDRLQMIAVLDYFDRSELLGDKRAASADNDYRSRGGTDQRFNFANPGTIRSVGGGNLPGLPSSFAAVPIGSTGIGLTPASFAATAGRENLDSFYKYLPILPETKRVSGLASATFDLTDSIQLFGDVLLMRRKDAVRQGPPTVTSRLVPASNPFNPFGVAVTATYMFEGADTAIERPVTTSHRETAGVKGKLGGWDWELSLLDSGERATDRVLNNFDAAKVNAALAQTNPALALNLFADGPAGSKALLDSLKAEPTVSRYGSTAIQGASFVRGTVVTLPTGSVEFAGGFEARRETLDFLPSSGATVVKDRRTVSAYAEGRIPLLGQDVTLPFVQDLSVTVAGRRDRYSDFGSATNGQYGLAWRVVPQLLLRSSYGTSFRAPSLYELYRPQTNLLSSILDPRRNNENAPLMVASGGNVNLSPEKSRSFTAGFVLASASGDLRLESSYWRVAQESRVQRLTPQLILANETFFSDRVVRSSRTAADIARGLPGALVSVDGTSINFGGLKTEGLDARASADIDLPLGKLRPSISGTWVAHYKSADFPNTPFVERVGFVNSQGSIPEWKATAILSWQYEWAELTGVARYTSSFRDVNSLGVLNGRTVSAQTLFDIQAAFDLGRLASRTSFISGSKLTVGVRNLFDKAPPFSDSGVGQDRSQSDPVQRFGYVSLSTKF